MVIFDLMKYVADLEELKTLYNSHFSLSSGDDRFWEDYATSPLFPVNEQPESDDFYMLYNYTEDHQSPGWWLVDATVSIYIASNSVKLITEVTDVLRKALGDFEYAARRMRAYEPNLHNVNWTRYDGADMIKSQDQENGVMGRILAFTVNYIDC